MLALTKNPVFNAAEALPSLIAALKDKREPVRVAAAWALAQLDKAEAQQALAELADMSDLEEPVRLEAYGAVATSVRQFGGSLSEKQIKAVREVVAAKGSAKLREAAAQVLGALSLSSEMVKDLIVSSPSVMPK
jgi:HEAT repeat protein